LLLVHIVCRAFVCVHILQEILRVDFDMVARDMFYMWSWIWGYPIHVFCDHNPLSYLTSNTPKNPRLLRWALALQTHELTFHYKAGNSAAMIAPDCLSRMGPDESETVSAE
jgi:hypothetical protein